jgi:hypothetical protein
MNLRSYLRGLWDINAARDPRKTQDSDFTAFTDPTD